MTKQLQKDVFINEDLRYFQLTNIFFDRPLNEEDIITLKEVFFSINNISQIYFKDTFDLKGIEIDKKENQDVWICDLVMNYETYNIHAEYESTGTCE